MLIVIRRKQEGERIPFGLLAIWWTRILDGISPLRGIGVAVMLPFPTFFKYDDQCMGALMQGIRLPRIAFRIGFVRGDKRKPTFNAGAWLQPVGKQTLIATREQIEDGEYPVSSNPREK